MSSELLTQILLAILTAAWVGDLIRGLFQKKKVHAESNLADASATQVIVASTTTLLRPLQDRVNELEEELVTVRREANKLVKKLQAVNAENSRLTNENMSINAENRRLRARLGEIT
jgi:FtsZ-binding cell division protein ZapB